MPLIQRVLRKLASLRKKEPTEVFAEIYRKNLWGGTESVSGAGSTLAETEAIREALPRLLSRWNTRVFLDAPCGDFSWMRYVQLPIERYIGMDIVPELIERNAAQYAQPGREFHVGDITADPLPSADAILCRHCLIHLSLPHGLAAVRNFKRTGAGYLMITTAPQVEENTDIVTGGWRLVNMERPPFNFPPAVEYVIDGKTPNAILGIYELPRISVPEAR